MDFVPIPAGSFQMGAPLGEQDSRDTERPVHTVTINYGFEMMTTPVTQGMWQALMGTDIYQLRDLENPAAGIVGAGPGYPVYYVSWNQAQDFIAVLNEMDMDYLYRLPSEAEWEYACRAGTQTRYYWGEDPDSSLIDIYAWHLNNSGGTTHPVGLKLPNPWGLYDMSGNSWEWCQDNGHPGYFGAPDDGSPWESPGVMTRVHRGGSSFRATEFHRSAFRGFRDQDGRNCALGFRLVRTAR
jgi:formylglycine-generating enzyme required for sulfatase activity